MTFMSAFYSFNAEANCQTLTNYKTAISFGNVVVQRDTPVGTVIATTSHPESGTQLAYCTPGGVQYEQMTYMFGRSAGFGHVYNTNLAGVGIKGTMWGQYPIDNPATYQVISTNANMYDKFGTSTFELVKTGDITTGSLNSGEVVRVTYDDGGVGMTVSLISSSVTVIACSITTPNLTFPIGDVLASSFGTTVGTIPSGAQNTQNLGLNCDAGTNVNVSLQGTRNPDVSTTSVLALTGQGNADVASGVGVQLLYNGSPLVLNNRIVLKRSSGGQETFPITARYYQTKTSVTTGKANASATLDLTYQ
jgi:Fimbrial protein.